MAGSTETVAAAVRAMPRLGSTVKLAVVCRVLAPEKVSWPGVGAPGAVPSALSAAMLRTPALIVVAPAYVLTPDRTRVPVPALVSVLAPAMIPPTVRVVAAAVLRVPAPVRAMPAVRVEGEAGAASAACRR